MQRSTREHLLALLGPESLNVGTLADTLGVTTQAVLYHLDRLRTDGLVSQVGRGRAARWVRTFDHRLVWDLTANDLAESDMWARAKDVMQKDLANISDATRLILDYTATEILNNAIDHSGGTRVELLGSCSDDVIEVVIIDDGIGAFKNVREHFDLTDELEAIAHLAKGQQTTRPDRHSGQGMFFSSRAVDIFEVAAGGRVWQVDNLRHDTTIMRSAPRPGTKVTLRTRRQRTTTLKDIFDRHSNEDYAFDRGTIRVKLSEHGREFISRSEAKRLALGLELYGRVELDFADVRAVGQGFVDELFRIWPADHPNTTMSYANANEEVAFMIERGLPRR